MLLNTIKRRTHQVTYYLYFALAAFAIAVLLAGCANPLDNPGLTSSKAGENGSRDLTSLNQIGVNPGIIGELPDIYIQQDVRMMILLDRLTSGINNDDARFRKIKEPLSNALNTWYKAPPASAGSITKPYTVFLRSLKCLETEDYTGDDECSLQIYVDGNKVNTFRKDLNNGNIYTLNTSYTYNDVFYLKLYDRDNPGFPLYDDDDWLGTVTIKNQPGTEYTAAFNRDGALYIITYDVSFAYTPALSDAQQRALVLNSYYHNYLNANTSPLSKLDNNGFRAALYRDIEAIVKDPYTKVNQYDTRTCGTSATIMHLALRFPEKFVDNCWEIFATNQLLASNGNIYNFPSSGNTFKQRLTPACWILTGTVNPSYSGTDNSKLEGIMKKLLPYKNIGTETTYVYGEEDAIRRAARIAEKGGLACLKINSDMMEAEYSTLGSWVWQSSDHIIVMLGSLSINSGNPIIWDSGHFTFNYWSWGRAGYMMYADEDRFEDGFLGLTYAY